jgi:hypothetical protein
MALLDQIVMLLDIVSELLDQVEVTLDDRLHRLLGGALEAKTTLRH